MFRLTSSKPKIKLCVFLFFLKDVVHFIHRVLYIFERKKSHINLDSEKNTPRSKMFQYCSPDFTTDPQKETIQYVHTKTLQSFVSAATDPPASCRGSWRADDDGQSLSCSHPWLVLGWAPGDPPKPRKTLHLPPGWRSKADKIIVETTALIKNGADWKEPPEQHKFSVLLLPFSPYHLPHPQTPCLLPVIQLVLCTLNPLTLVLLS